MRLQLLQRDEDCAVLTDEDGSALLTKRTTRSSMSSPSLITYSREGVQDPILHRGQLIQWHLRQIDLKTLIYSSKCYSKSNLFCWSSKVYKLRDVKSGGRATPSFHLVLRDDKTKPLATFQPKLDLHRPISWDIVVLPPGLMDSPHQLFRDGLTDLFIITLLVVQEIYARRIGRSESSGGSTTPSYSRASDLSCDPFTRARAFWSTSR